MRTDNREEHPVLYISEAENNSAARVAFESLYFQIMEINNILIGAHDALKDFRKVAYSDHQPPLAIIDAAMNYMRDLLWDITPHSDKDGRTFEVKRLDDGSETIVFEPTSKTPMVDL